jgi:hypothetical protein
VVTLQVAIAGRHSASCNSLSGARTSEIGSRAPEHQYLLIILLIYLAEGL